MAKKSTITAEYAKGWSRLGAAILDSLIISIPVTVLFIAAALLVLNGQQEQLKDIILSSKRLTDNPDLVSNIRLLAIIYTSLTTGLQALYYIGFTSSKYQATPGKRFLRLKVVNAHTMERITTAQAVKRYLIRDLQLWTAAFFALFLPAGAEYFSNTTPQIQLISALFTNYKSDASAVVNAANAIAFLSIVWILFDARGQGLHDKFADTAVVKS